MIGLSTQGPLQSPVKEPFTSCDAVNARIVVKCDSEPKRVIHEKDRHLGGANGKTKARLANRGWLDDLKHI